MAQSWIGLCRHTSLLTVLVPQTEQWPLLTLPHIWGTAYLYGIHFLALVTSGPKRQVASSSNCHSESVGQQLHKHKKIKHKVHEMIQVFGVLHWTVWLLTASAMKECTAFIFLESRKSTPLPLNTVQLTRIINIDAVESSDLSHSLCLFLSILLVSFFFFQCLLLITIFSLK
jgi:hypothetical protein